MKHFLTRAYRCTGFSVLLYLLGYYHYYFVGYMLSELQFFYQGSFPPLDIGFPAINIGILLAFALTTLTISSAQITRVTNISLVSFWLGVLIFPAIVFMDYLTSGKVEATVGYLPIFPALALIICSIPTMIIAVAIAKLKGARM